MILLLREMSSSNGESEEIQTWHFALFLVIEEQFGVLIESKTKNDWQVNIVLCFNSE
jgi:hypothetical protein